MILNIGVDIEQISRFKNKDKLLLEKIFSPKEIRRMKKQNAQHLAGLFSAKESIIKACTPIEKLQLRDIEIFNNKDGSPYAIIKKSKHIKTKDLKISISHTGEYALATAILMKNE